jgi:hypothetical protein
MLTPNQSTPYPATVKRPRMSASSASDISRIGVWPAAWAAFAAVRIDADSTIIVSRLLLLLRMSMARLV